MRAKTIDNPGGAWTAGATWSPATADSDTRLICMMVNNSGASLSPGDVVVCTNPQGVNVTTTTTASDPTVLGVVGEPPGGDGTVGAASSGYVYAAGANVPVIVFGHCRINIGANTVAANDNLATSGTAKQAATPANAASVAALQALLGSFIARAQEASAAKDANNTIRCMVGAR